MRGALGVAKAERSAAREALEGARDTAAAADETHAQELRRIDAASKERLDELLGAHARELHALREDGQREREASEARCSGLSEQLAAAAARFDARPPRAEDTALIDSLRRGLRETEEALRRAKEQMRFFKLELQNREANYNGLFGNQPRVLGSTGSPPVNAGIAKTGKEVAGVSMGGRVLTKPTEQPAAATRTSGQAAGALRREVSASGERGRVVRESSRANGSSLEVAAVHVRPR